MDKVVRFYHVAGKCRLLGSCQLPLDKFNERYEPDRHTVFNPPRGEMPFTYYRNKRSRNRFMVAAVLTR